MQEDTAWTSHEVKNKIVRISELGQLGFNIPRLFSIPMGSSEKIVDLCSAWADIILADDPEQIFNIRTYRFRNRTETIHTPHITDILSKDLKGKIYANIGKFDLMIDAETPDNGRFAGNIVMEYFIGSPLKFYMDYCKKEIRAMVREADTKLAGYVHHLVGGDRKLHKKIPEEIRNVVKEAMSREKFNVVLEWTHFCKPAGVKRENLVFWEYRNASKILDIN